jgi:hypothetical protein
MINADMHLYNFFTFGDDDGYGMPELSKEPKGRIKMAINITSQGTQDNILYKDCSYMGLTLDDAINDTYVIEYGAEKLKVLYINPRGRYKQVFMQGM